MFSLQFLYQKVRHLLLQRV